MERVRPVHLNDNDGKQRRSRVRGKFIRSSGRTDRIPSQRFWASTEAAQEEGDTPLKHTPSLDSIEERLSRALRQFVALPGVGEQIIGTPLSSAQLNRAVKNILDRKSEWLAAVPAFRDVQHWVEVHWDTERQTQPPAGTVSDGDRRGAQGEVQLDALTATCKLLLAAAGHGVETVAKYALEFASHGMIEVRSFYLLKGVSLSNAKPLDKYCTLLPYQEGLQKVNAERSARYLEEDLYWPPETTDDVCALEVKSFERRGVVANEFERRVSPLLQCGLDTLALILGLVWGTGFRVFGHWHSVAAPAAATLPFLRTAFSSSEGSQQILLTLPGFRWPSTNRPLNNAELAELIGKYAALSEQTQRKLNLALRRLRDGVERIELEDKVIDVCIALEALFMEGGENIRETVSSRGSWYFSDSHLERKRTDTLLKKFYDDRSYIVHGNTSKSLTRKQKREQKRNALLADIEDVVRASLKTMISEGRPQDWEDSKDMKSIRHDPPRAETEIPSVKSDSLSWTVAEQNEIDQALETVWKPTVDNAPAPPPDASSVTHHGIDRQQIEQYEQQGTYYIIRIPVLLYMAHPKWIERAGEPLDEHTRYYCEKDVERHMRRWQEAADEKKIHQFELPLEDAITYLPKRFDSWRTLLPEEPEQGEQP